ncbi:MAG: OmpA family protein [Candidatus Edwardsbacteria bacterium]|nr:OmpA family protein [Candidatus Edwardsbacteria bacterium]MBU1576274.1 OmpA family protein [Candidatus Edwardsbacteria bacterium]MBU2462673.1 OmpA family protein [Candidatus Edwardsbacteria bacterium]MBU2594456.1 OmpA family protein [Candidatus Edwardsbacteria bacterium]
MKRIAFVFTVLIMVAGMAMATPSMYGSNGLVRTIAPDNCGPMSFGIGFRGFFSMGDIDTNSSWMSIDVVPMGNIAFNDMLELSIAPTYSFNQWSMTTPDTSGWENGTKDARIGLKATFLRGEGFNMGAYLGYDYRWNKKFSGYYAWVNEAWEKDSNYTPTGVIHFTLIPGYNAGNFKAHLNLGMAMNLDKYDVGDGVNRIYPNIGIPFGLGMSYDAGMVTPFLEVTGKAGFDTLQYYDFTATPVDSVKRGIMNNPFWVTGGLRFDFGSIKMDLGGEMNFQTDDTTHTVNMLNGKGLGKGLDWQVFMGLAYTKCNLGPKVPPTGIISGKVVDKAGKGLAAVVMAGGITANTDPATGAYTLSGVLIDKAPVEIKADAKGYIAKQASIMLTKKNKKKPAMQDFTLELKPIPASEVTGMITNYKDGSPMAGATINFKGPKAVIAKTDAAGKYTAKLEQGNYQAVVSADGFKNKTFSVVAKDGKPAAQNIALVKQKETFTFGDIYFPSGKAAITPKAEAKLEGLYKVLSENPEIKVEIAGHTDGLGSNRVNLKLSQSRAEAVKTWLEAKGIAADKLVAKGYGENKPIASNKTRAGRAQNRRIEINVID